MSRKIEISAAYARLVLQSGFVAPEELLQGVDLSPRALANMEFVEAGDLLVLLRNYDRCNNDRPWTAHLGSQLNAASHGPLGFAALSAPTLGQAMDVMGEFHAARNTCVVSETMNTETHYILRFTDMTGEADLARWLAETVSKIVEELLASILGHRAGKEVTITFTHNAPTAAQALIDAYDATLTFNAPENAIAVPLSWRHLPSPLADESVYRANIIKCRDIIAARETTDSVVRGVRSLLTNHFDRQLLQQGQPAAPPILNDVAQSMHITARTLIRRLQREDSAYKIVLEEIRREYAQQLLRDPRFKIAEIAELLGYKEPANFGRAFKRWYGVSPAAWRRR